MIQLTNISKTFKVAKREAGLKAATRALFHKEYTYIKALQDVSFTIGDGEMVGYIGPNGAGKSSTIKIMSGVLTPDSGECIINGRVPWQERTDHVRENVLRTRRHSSVVYLLDYPHGITSASHSEGRSVCPRV